MGMKKINSQSILILSDPPLVLQWPPASEFRKQAKPHEHNRVLMNLAAILGFHLLAHVTNKYGYSVLKYYDS